MRGNITRIGATFLIFLGAFGIAVTRDVLSASADSTTEASTLQAQLDAHTQEIAQLNQEIAHYQAELQEADADKKTLQDAINALDLQKKTVETQISETQDEISATQLQIQQLGSTIANTQDTIAEDQAALAEDIRSLDEADDEPLIARLFSSDSLSEEWSDADAVLEVQSAIQNNVSALQTQENNLANSQSASKQKKIALTSQKKTLTSQQQSLTQTTQSKSKLLSETDAKESNYQKLLAEAKAELASFSAFAENAGGSGLLANQTSCDAWGCYYNQRDVAWGNDRLDGTQYLLKSDGCLVTSMAMVMTHYGYRSVTPVSINANPENFAAYYPAYLLFTIYVDGISATRKTATINATLATGDPVIVGIYAYGGTHFIVLTSGTDGDYLMRDPYIPNGKDISFSAHYSLNNIFEISKVEIE
jgi:peptidoglycan hydrolase CwlO-like protein